MKNLMTKTTLLMSVLIGALPAIAQEAGHAATETAGSSGGFYAIAAGVAIAFAALGGALGQAKIGAAAMDGIARNPSARESMFIPMIIGLALIESLVIYALVIAFMLVGKA